MEELAEVDLPDDLAMLKRMVIEHRKEITANVIAIRDLSLKLSWAEEKYRAMELRYFGRSSEKYSPADDRQGRLFDEAEAFQDPTAPAVVERVTVPEHQRKKRGRKGKPDNLPVREVIHELTVDERACPSCGTERPVIGEERSSEYHLVPAHVEKIVHVRRKYGPCTCDAFEAAGLPQVVTAPAPAKIVKGSDFSNQTIAFFITAKYADAIPYYRMARMLGRSGLVVSRQALSNMAVSVALAIADLTDMMRSDLLSSPVMLMDETTLQVLHAGSGPPGTSYMWVMRGYHDGKPIICFAWHANRSGKFADTLLEGFHGFLQTDGYAGYDHLDAGVGIVHVGCFAHIRRKFTEAWETAGKTGRAKEAVDTIARIYGIEHRMRTQFESGEISEDEFTGRRKQRVEPVILELRIWLQDRLLDTAPQSALGRAVSYALHILGRAALFVEHALLTPDTNLVENAIRPFVIGRKNWLFSGSALGAHSSASLYSLLETARANGHEPYAYLCHLFDFLPRCTTLEEKRALLPYRLTPSAYAQHQAN